MKMLTRRLFDPTGCHRKGLDEFRLFFVIK